MRWSFPVCVTLCLIAAPQPAATADVALSVEVEGLTSTARAGAPVPVVVRLIWNGGGLLEGHLYLTIRDEADVLARVRVDDVVVSGGEQRFRAMLPAVSSNNRFGELSLDVEFETDGGTIDLGNHSLRIPGQWQRWFGMCVCAPWDVSDHPALRKLAGGLQLEQFHPDRQTGQAALAAREIGTSMSTVSPGEMPRDPLSYCAFDLVVLDAASFAALESDQLQALRQWVNAGGNVCVFAGESISPQHAAFLNELVGASEYLLDTQGRLMTPDKDAQREIRFFRYGVGRGAILHGAAEAWENVDEERWRAVAAWLWRVRREQQDYVVERGAWNPAAVIPTVREWQQWQGQPGSGTLPLMALSPAPLQSGQQLLNRLMPEDVEVVPLGLIALILVVYVLLIGPADYFVLGWVRQRKLTWVVFPAVTVGATLLTVWLSHLYMGASANRRAITFIDIGEGGGVARQSRFEMLFTGSAQEMQTEMRRALLTPLDHQRLGGAVYDPRYGFQNANADLLVGPARYAGRMPAQYVVAQDIPQWTPQINRHFAIAPEAEVPRFDWSSVEPESLVSRDLFSPQQLDEMRQQFTGSPHVWSPVYRSAIIPTDLQREIQQAFGSGTSVYLFHRSAMYRFNNNEVLVWTNAPNSKNLVQANEQTTDISGFVGELCVKSDGLFSIVSTVAPAGGSGFDDLPLLDSSNPNEWLLVIAVDHGDELVIYRKLYTGQ